MFLQKFCQYAAGLTFPDAFFDGGPQLSAFSVFYTDHVYQPAVSLHRIAAFQQLSALFIIHIDESDDHLY